MKGAVKSLMRTDHRQISFFRDIEVHAGAHRYDVRFLHEMFCIAGLPHRNPKTSDGIFRKSGDKFGLTIAPADLTLPGGNTCKIGVPFGAKARLLVVWASSEAKDPQRAQNDRWVEIGHIATWLQSIGVKSISGDAMTTTKDQLVRLAFSHFTMIYRATAEHTLFQADRLFDGGAFGNDDLSLYAQGQVGKMRWPAALQLSAKALKTFREDAVPIPPTRLAQVSRSSLAIDLFVFLCYRLPSLSADDSILVSWRELSEHFGHNEPPSVFRDSALPSLALVKKAYEEANFDVTDEGLVLRYSDPAVLRCPFLVVKTPDAGITGPKRRRRSAVGANED